MADDEKILGIKKSELTELVRQILAEMPTSLPANGGNADTVCGMKIMTDTITSNSDGAGYVWLPYGNARKYISATVHGYVNTNMYIDGTTGNTNLQIPDAIIKAVTIDIAWLE